MSQVVQLSEVTAERRGSSLVVAAAVSATTLTVEYAGDFNGTNLENPAQVVGTLDLNGTALDYLGVTEGSLPDDPDVINLAAPLAVAAAVGDIVGAMDGGQVLTDYWAVCSHEDGDQIMVPITDQQIPFYQVGVYDPPAPIMVSDDLLHLESAPGRTPNLDGAFLADGSVGGTQLSADAIDGRVITGSLVRTAASGERVELQVVGDLGSHGQLSFWTNNAVEDPASPGAIYGDDSSTRTRLGLVSSGLKDNSGNPVTFQRAVISLTSVRDPSVSTVGTSVVDVTATDIYFFGNVHLPDTTGQVACSADSTATSTTNVTITGMSKTITALGTSDVWMVDLDLDMVIGVANTVNIVELVVDGTAQSVQIVTNGPAGRWSAHKRFRLTGLSAGTHTLTARTRNTAGSTSATVKVGNSVLTVERVAAI